MRDGTIWSDLVFLTTAMNWATRWRDKEGRYLMRENPARGFAMPKDKNPRRPVATEDRFQKRIHPAPVGRPGWGAIVGQWPVDRVDGRS